MFTGLAQEVGKITRLQRVGGVLRWTIQAPICAAQLKRGDSINVAGACQTVESLSADSLSGTAIAETLRKTTFAHWTTGSLVNLELPLRADDRLGGHIVSGHVDAVGRVTRRTDDANGTQVAVHFAAEFDRWTVDQGSIALDGVSLTIAGRSTGAVTVALIPETLKRTTLGILRVGDDVNIEFDQLVKAAVQQIDATRRDSSRIDTNLLATSGW
jgi:riboflavin synthase